MSRYQPSHRAACSARSAHLYPALNAALAYFARGWSARPADLAEIVILSTCNRLELYAAQAAGGEPPSGFAAPEGLLAETLALPLVDLSQHFYRFTDQAAIAHLGRVAGGPDSMILGEPQILGQVAQGAAERALAGLS